MKAFREMTVAELRSYRGPVSFGRVTWDANGKTWHSDIEAPGDMVLLKELRRVAWHLVAAGKQNIKIIRKGSRDA